VDENGKLWLRKYLQGGMQFDGEDRDAFLEMLSIAKDICGKLSKEGIDCTRGEVLTFMLWRSQNPKTGQIWPR